MIFTLFPFSIVEAATSVATPAFSVAAGTYASSQIVAISSTTSGAAIRYTTDGTTPTASSTVYSTPITVSSSETVKDYAIKAGLTDSVVSSAAYVIQLNQLNAPTNLVASSITTSNHYHTTINMYQVRIV